MAKIFFPQYRRGREGIEIGEGTILEHAQRLGEEIAKRIEHTKPNELEPEFAYMVAEKMYF